jgi:2-isopropylmalate synthase
VVRVRVLRGEESQAWIYDWNVGPGSPGKPPFPVELNDETLRDGLQSPSVRHPTVEEKKEILHRMAELGIHRADIGYPGSSPRALADVVALAREIDQARLPIRPNCAGRTAEPDIVAIAEAQQRSGVALEAALFLGSSPIRQYAEGWDLDFLLRTTEQAVRRARSLGLEVMYVTEDTTRARPAHRVSATWRSSPTVPCTSGATTAWARGRSFCGARRRASRRSGRCWRRSGS